MWAFEKSGFLKSSKLKNNQTSTPVDRPKKEHLGCSCFDIVVRYLFRPPLLKMPTQPMVSRYCTSTVSSFLFDKAVTFANLVSYLPNRRGHMLRI